MNLEWRLEEERETDKVFFFYIVGLQAYTRIEKENLGGTVQIITNSSITNYEYKDPKKVQSFLWVLFLFLNMQNSLEHLEQEIELLQARNSRVDAEKKWETSWQRRLGIIMTTYFVMILVFWSLGNDRSLMNAIIPTLGYTLSTLSMGWLKRIFVNQK